MRTLPRFIVAATIDGWAFRTHRSQVGRQFSAVVNAVIVQETKIRHGGKIEGAHEIDGSAELLRRQCENSLGSPFEVFVIPLRDFR